MPGGRAGRLRVLLTVVASFRPGWLGVNHLIALFIVFKKLEETFGSIYLQGPLLCCISEGFNSSHAQELTPWSLYFHLSGCSQNRVSVSTHSAFARYPSRWVPCGGENWQRGWSVLGFNIPVSISLSSPPSRYFPLTPPPRPNSPFSLLPPTIALSWAAFFFYNYGWEELSLMYTNLGNLC